MKKFLPAIFGFFLPGIAHAYRLTDSGWDCTGFVGCGTVTDGVAYVMGRLILIIGTFIFALTVVVFLYGAFRMTTSRGEEGKEAGKKAMIYASLGFVAAFLTAGIFRFVCDYMYLLGGTSGTVVCSIWP